MKRLVLSVKIAVIAALCLTATTAFTLPADQWDVNYYTGDATNGYTWVGEDRRLCDGSRYRDGQQWGTYEDVWQVSCSGYGELHTCYYIDPWTGGRSAISCPYF
jgi:hypothetical protein